MHYLEPEWFDYLTILISVRYSPILLPLNLCSILLMCICKFGFIQVNKNQNSTSEILLWSNFWARPVFQSHYYYEILGRIDILKYIAVRNTTYLVLPHVPRHRSITFFIWICSYRKGRSDQVLNGAKLVRYYRPTICFHSANKNYISCCHTISW